MKNLKLASRNQLPHGFATLTELQANQLHGLFVDDATLVPFINAKIAAYDVALKSDAPAALDTLGEIATRLAAMGASDDTTTAFLANVIANFATKSYVDAEILTRPTESRVGEVLAYWRTHVFAVDSQSISDAGIAVLRAEIMAALGVDDDEFTRISGLFTQLSQLEATDHTGIVTALTLKIDKSKILDYSHERVQTRAWDNLLDGSIPEIEGLILTAPVIRGLLGVIKTGKADLSHVNSLEQTVSNQTLQINQLLQDVADLKAMTAER